MKIFGTILLLLLCAFGLPAQNTDSLKRAALSGPDTSRIDAQTQLAKYLSADDPKEAMRYANLAFEGAEELGDERRKAWALNYMGSIYYYQGNYDSSYYFHKQALDIRLTINDPKGLGASYNNIGLIYDDQGKSKEALEYYLKAVEQFKKCGFRLGIGIAYGSIGNLYYYQEDYVSAGKYFEYALNTTRELGDLRGTMNNYNNLALVFEATGDTAKALDYLGKAIDIARSEGFTSMLATGYNNLGQLYLAKKQFDKAMGLFRLSVSLCDSMDDAARKITPVLNIGYCYFDQGNYDSAVYYANEGLQYAQRFGWLESQMQAHKLLARALFAKGDYMKAYEARINYEVYKDSVFNEEKAGQLTEMQTKYDTEQVQKDNLLKDEKLKSQARERWFYIIGAILVAIVAFIILLSWRRTRKLNALLNEQKVEILEKNSDLSRKNDLIEEQKHEITSSIEYASHIQSAMLPAPGEFKAVFPQSFVFYRPRDIVSGDFYFVAGDQHQAVVAVADCTGHGVPGAMMSMIGMDKLREAVSRYDAPGEMLAHLNRAVKNSLRRSGETKVNDGMDIVLCKIDFVSMKMSSAAANRPLLIIRNGVMIDYKATKTAIGGLTPDDQEFRTETILLERGDMIYLFSDGFADQFGGPEGKKFMIRRFRELLNSISGLPVSEQLIGLEKGFDDWKRGLDQIDDVLVVGIRV